MKQVDFSWKQAEIISLLWQILSLKKIKIFRIEIQEVFVFPRCKALTCKHGVAVYCDIKPVRPFVRLLSFKTNSRFQLRTVGLFVPEQQKKTKTMFG